MNTYQGQVDEAFEFLQKRFVHPPEVILILGTGLGDFSSRIEQQQVIPYGQIPHCPGATGPSHQGCLVYGRCVGHTVAVLQGRLHYYEGYSAKELTFPLRALTLFRPSVCIITNAAGGLNTTYAPGSLMAFKDHINFIPDNPLRGVNIDSWGPRFPDLSQPYDSTLSACALEAAKNAGLTAEQGVYACIPGPSLETPAETRFLRSSGADAVGMSTVPEVIVARHAGLRVLALSIIANSNDPDNFVPIRLEEVLEQMNRVAPKVQEVLSSVIEDLKP